MRTNVDADLDIPEITDFSRFGPNRYARPPGEPMEILIDGAVEYSLRLIPSNTVLGRFRSTLDAWPAVVAAVDDGRSSRTLVLDWHAADGKAGRVSSGATLEFLARSSLGLPTGHLDRRPSLNGSRERKG
jgi:hypothetical protein